MKGSAIDGQKSKLLASRAYGRKHFANLTPEKLQRKRDQTTARYHGFPSPEAMLEWRAARPTCEICGNEPKHIDHCHATGVVRGHLCRQCNLALGMFQDSPELLDKAKEYLGRSTSHSLAD